MQNEDQTNAKTDILVEAIFLFLETDCTDAESVYNKAQEVTDSMRCSRCDERLKQLLWKAPIIAKLFCGPTYAHEKIDMKIQKKSFNNLEIF